MKKNLLLLVLLFLASICFGQIPQAFSFQALAIDSNGDPISDMSIGVLIEILDSGSNGVSIYSESHNPQTNENGLYTIEIGNGNNNSSIFSDIDWLNGSKFISLHHDITGGTNYTLVGSSQLLSVPYALASGSSFIKPMIYASVKRTGTTTFDISRPDTEEFVTFNYEWIQGIPETIFIEYSNLPDNIHLQNTFFGQRTDNFSRVDTIVDGIVRPLTRFVHTDQSVPLVVGRYVVDMVFRTETEVLATIEYPIDIIESTVEITDCTAQFIGARSVISACDSLQNLTGTSMEVITQNETAMTLNNFLNLGISVEVEFLDGIECNDLIFTNSPQLEMDNFTFSDFEGRRDQDKLEFTFEVFDSNGIIENFSCTVTYQ